MVARDRIRPGADQVAVDPFETRRREDERVSAAAQNVRDVIVFGHAGGAGWSPRAAGRFRGASAAGIA
jgi:hypothetical protein